MQQTMSKEFNRPFLTLTSSNYYSAEANRAYQSASVFKGFMQCEAAELAKLSGEWEPNQDPTALLVGNYLHSHFESPEAHQAFLNDHPEILATTGKNRGQPKAPYQVADKMIATLEDDPVFNQIYQGKKELIITGEIGGVKWMGKLDCFADNHKYFADLKTTQDIHKRFWLDDDRRWASFIEAYNYPLQMAVYQELIRQTYDVEAMPIIVAVSKQEPPDKALVDIPQSLLDFWLDKVIELQPHIQAVKDGKELPTRCEQCEYCRATKKLSGITPLEELVGR